MALFHYINIPTQSSDIDHGSTQGLGDDDHTGYFLLAGRPGGQVGNGGNAPGDDLTFSSTAHATKGLIYLGSAATSAYDETADYLGIGTATPGAPVHGYNSTANANEIQLLAEQGGTGDASVALVIAGVSEWHVQVDNDDGDKLKIWRHFPPSSPGYIMTWTETGQVGVGTESPDASAIFEIASTTQGFLMPVMTEAQRDAITSPAEGLQVHNLTTSIPNYYDGSVWKAIGSDTTLYSIDGTVDEARLVTLNNTLTLLSTGTTYKTIFQGNDDLVGSKAMEVKNSSGDLIIDPRNNRDLYINSQFYFQNSNGKFMVGLSGQRSEMYPGEVDVYGSNGTDKFQFVTGATPYMNFTGHTAFQFRANSNVLIELDSTGSGQLGFFGGSTVAQQLMPVGSLTALTQAGSFTPDYAIQAMTNTGPYGFASLDEAETVLSVIKTNQARIDALITIMNNYNLVV